MNIIRNFSGLKPNESGVVWLAMLIGALLAFWMVFQEHGAINSDGIMYVEVAKLFSAGKWHEGIKLYPAPLFPYLILVVHNLSGLGYQISAHALAIFGFAVASGGLVVLVRTVGGDRFTMLAAMLLLFASPYLVGDVLSMILRDQLFWAVHLWSLIFFIRFYRDDDFRDAMAWGALAALAVMFRIEALSYLLFLPLAFLADYSCTWRRRWLRLARANLVLIGVLLVAGAVIVLFPSLRMERLGRLQDPIYIAMKVVEQLSHGLDVKSRIFAEEVLGKFLKDYAFSGLLITLLYALITKALSSAGWLQLAVALFGRSSGLRARVPSFNSIFIWLILLGLVNAVFILFAQFLLPKRYLVPVAFVILIYAAFGLQNLYDAWVARKADHVANRWILPGVGCALAVQMLMAIWPSSHPNPEIDAARWLNEHASPDSSIYYDSRRIRYYTTGDSSNRKRDAWPKILEHFEGDTIRQYDYLVVRISKNNPERQEMLTLRAGVQPQASFDNGRGDKVLIYQITR